MLIAFIYIVVLIFLLSLQYREHGVTEQMWRSRQALRPYFNDVRSIVRRKAMLPCLRGYRVVDESNLSFVHFPIKDCSVTDDDRVLELARALVKAIAENEIIYLHCWGGHGRTGTLVCIMLHLMYGYSDTQAMEYCQAVHDLRQCPVVVGSPQTQTQRDQVSRVIQKLMTQSRFRSRTMSGDGSMLTGGSTESSSVPLPAEQTLQSTLVSPRATLGTSANHTVSMASPQVDNKASEGAEPQDAEHTLPPATVPEALTTSSTVHIAQSNNDTNTVEKTLFATPKVVQDDLRQVCSVPTPPKASNSNDTSLVADERMSICETAQKDASLCRNNADVQDELVDDYRMRIASEGGASVNLLHLKQEMEETEQDDPDIEVRVGEPVQILTAHVASTTTPAHPPVQVKPSFAFNRKGIATNQ